MFIAVGVAMYVTLLNVCPWVYFHAAQTNEDGFQWFVPVDSANNLRNNEFFPNCVHS